MDSEIQQLISSILLRELMGRFRNSFSIISNSRYGRKFHTNVRSTRNVPYKGTMRKSYATSRILRVLLQLDDFIVVSHAWIGGVLVQYKLLGCYCLAYSS